MPIISQPISTLISSTPDAESLIAQAYGICTGRETIPIDHIPKYIQQSHLSPLEHAGCTFLLTCSRVVLAELTRHRLCSFSARSQRFVKESEPSYFLPPEITDHEARHRFEAAMREAWSSYQALLLRGLPKQISRYVLPNSCLTEILVTANLREWRHIIELRAAPAAQPEFRCLAQEILRQLYIVAPRVFGDLYEKYIAKEIT